MDKITIILQDKETIKELAKDPDVQIKIKDAVIDGIGKRASKIANLSDDIIHKLEEDIRNYFTEIDNSMWKKRNVLKPEFKELIRKEANNAFNLSVSKELLDMHKIINNRLDEIKTIIMDRITNGLNLEKIVSDAAEKVIKEKLK